MALIPSVLSSASLSGLYSFTSHTFTSAGRTGQTGPSLSECRTAYASTSWASNTSSFNMTITGYQLWTVPMTGTYTFTVAGAGPSTPTGTGRVIRFNFTLTQGDILKIVVGQQGLFATSYSNQGAGGSGGTFVTTSTNTILGIAGGAGGFGNATASDPAQNGNSTNGGAGGTGGNGGLGGGNGPAAGGAGYSGNGTFPGSGGSQSLSFLNNGMGGLGYNSTGAGSVEGGFGGGGGGYLNNTGGPYFRSGGGGGYSGGGGGGYNGGYASNSGGGGSSFVSPSATNVNTSFGTNTGAGYVTVSI